MKNEYLLTQKSNHKSREWTQISENNVKPSMAQVEQTASCQPLIISHGKYAEVCRSLLTSSKVTLEGDRSSLAECAVPCSASSATSAAASPREFSMTVSTCQKEGRKADEQID